MKATNGPWECGEPTKTKLSGYGVIDIIPIGGSGLAIGAVWLTELNNGEANARLIAAAPELLEALRMVCDSGIAIAEPIERAMLDAIAKARGGT